MHLRWRGDIPRGEPEAPSVKQTSLVATIGTPQASANAAILRFSRSSSGSR